MYKNYSKKQFDAYFINILDIVFEYYQYWLQWISLNSFKHDCSKRSHSHSKHYYSEIFYVIVKCKWNAKYCKVFHDTTYAGVWIW